jgi:hypothetical protein
LPWFDDVEQRYLEHDIEHDIVRLHNAVDNDYQRNFDNNNLVFLLLRLISFNPSWPGFFVDNF